MLVKWLSATVTKVFSISFGILCGICTSCYHCLQFLSPSPNLIVVMYSFPSSFLGILTPHVVVDIQTPWTRPHTSTDISWYDALIATSIKSKGGQTWTACSTHTHSPTPHVIEHSFTKLHSLIHTSPFSPSNFQSSKCFALNI